MADVTLAGTIDATSSVAGVLTQSVAPTYPAPSASGMAPGGPVEFEFLSTEAGSRIEDFEDGVFPSWWLNCSPANGFTATGWNDGTDQWDIYDDSGNDVLRAQGRATALATGSERAFLDLSGDFVVRVCWFTGATAGLFARGRFDSYGKTTDMRGAFAEIDSGGLRLGYYASGSRDVDATAAFSPVSGTWYWIRLQIAGPWEYRIRCKYWTGTRDSEPSSWNLEDTGGIDKRNERWKGNGVHVNAGTAYFDDFEIVGELAAADLEKLTAEFNGEVYSYGDPIRTLVIEPYVEDPRETWFSALGAMPFPTPHNWRCSLGRAAAFDHDTDGVQTVTVKWEGDTLKTWTFETASIPADPFDESGAGDPGRIGLFKTPLDSSDPMGRWFSYVLELFSERMGTQKCSYAIAPIGWRGNFEHFEYVVYAVQGFGVNGQYYIAHPVVVRVPASVVAGQPKRVVVPASVVPEGSRRSLTPASVVPQGYKRTYHPASVIASVRFTFRGRASGIVSVSFLEKVPASGIVFDTIRDDFAEVQVIDEETYQALIDAGVDWS